MQKNPTLSTTDLETNVSINTEEAEVPLDAKVKSKKLKTDSKEYKDLMKILDIEEGICVVYCPHTTCGITVNENCDPAVYTHTHKGN